MKNSIAAALCLCIFLSCNPNNKMLSEKIAGSDSVAINFFKGDGTMDTVVAVKIIRDSAKLEQLVNLIADDATTLQNNCGYDGSIHFFKNNMVVQDIDFRMNDDKCSQFSFSIQGKRCASTLSAGAKQLLESIKK